MKIYFIRHGEGNHNKTEDWNILYPRLTERGREQCMKVREEMEGEEVDLILVSPLRRTLETGSIIFKDRKLVGLEYIREYIQNPCDYMEKIEEIRDDFKGVDLSKIEEEENKREHEEDLRRRVEKLKYWLRNMVYLGQTRKRRFCCLNVTSCLMIRCRIKPWLRGVD